MAEKDPDQRRTRILYLESGFSIFMLVHVYSLIIPIYKFIASIRLILCDEYLIIVDCTSFSCPVILSILFYSLINACLVNEMYGGVGVV